MNHALARALRSAGLTRIDVAARLGVDPKTVDRWMTGRQPYPRHRDALAEMTGWSPRDLWSDLPRPIEPATQADEVRTVYPHRSVVPADAWSRLFASAEDQIDILAYSALFVAEDIPASAVLRDKARAGVRIRIAFGDPNGIHIGRRGREEQVNEGMSARIRTALVGFRRVVEAGAEMRLHDTVLYNSIYRADGQLLVNAHVYGHPGAHSPVFHLQQFTDVGLAATYLESFQQVWAASREPDGVC